MLRFTIITFLLIIYSIAGQAQQRDFSKEDFSVINLDYTGLEKAKKAFNKGDYNNASKELLAYYRNRKGALTANTTPKKVSANVQKLADDILLHKFKPHKSYGTYDYGKDINWYYRPVKDHVLTSWLHRNTFWESLATVYLATGDEKYAKEWFFQMNDYMKKNKRGAHPDDKDFGWKPFLVSFRLNNWTKFFNDFINSPHFTPAFLIDFLKLYSEQADYVMANYTDIGNHRLFEAEHLQLVGTRFPELVNADAWRKSGIDVLNTEIAKQVYPDGMQFELSTTYHMGAIATFLRGLTLAQESGTEQEYPKSYRDLVEKMILAVPKFSFPDYSIPLYGNSFLTTKAAMLKNYQTWSQAFPKNKEIEYFATDGKSGTRPSYLSSRLENAGFYAFRSGLDMQSTVMQIKAGPPAEFHSHPDNGNFVLWVKGRDFTPDAGSYIYANIGGLENKKRDWYRSTKAHQTLTLDDETLINNAKLVQWKPEGDVQILSYTNPSYKNFTHQRTFLFINQSYFIIIDKASGSATGKLGIRFNLKEDVIPVFNEKLNAVHTTYSDGNNLLIQNFNADKVALKKEESFVSYEYQKEMPRPAFVFEKQKADTNAQTFVTILYPYQGQKPPQISITENKGNDFKNGKIDITVTVEGKSRNIKTTF